MYILDLNLLRKGDIILTAERALLSKGVRFATLGRFSHAILYVGDGSYIHSDGKGVHSANIQRLLFKTKHHACVLRTNNFIFTDKACVYARLQIGKMYSVKEAIRTKKNYLQAKEDNRQFCSRLVAQAYESAGLKLAGNIDYCTPKNIYKSKKLHVVPTCIRKATKQDIEHADSFNPIKEQTRITNEILEYVRLITKEDIQTFEQLTSYFLKSPSFDSEISNFIVQTGYFDMWQYEYQTNKWRYDYQELISLSIDEKKMIDTCTTEVGNAIRRKELYSFNLTEYIKLENITKCKYFQLNVALYRNLVRLADENIQACTLYLNSKT